MDSQNDNRVERVQDFMLAEYETLRSIRSDIISLGQSNVNFFFAIVSGAIVGLGLLSQSPVIAGIIPIITGIILSSCFLLGVIVFARTVERDIGITIYTRGLNRIRRHFVQLSPDIEDYLILPVNDDIPPFASVGFLRKGSYVLNLSGIVSLINSVIASTGILVLVKSVFASSVELLVIIGVVTLLMVYLYSTLLCEMVSSFARITHQMYY